MDGDLFGYTPPPKHQKLKKNSGNPRPPVKPELYFPVYRLDVWPLVSLFIAIAAFLLWYVFGAELVQLGPLEFRELSSPLYGALAWSALAGCLVWFTASFVGMAVCYGQREPDRRIWKRYRSKAKARLWSCLIGVSYVALISFGCLLIFHGYGNAKKFGLLAYEKLSRYPVEADITVVAQPSLKSDPGIPLQDNPLASLTQRSNRPNSARFPTVSDPKNMIETGSIDKPRPGKKAIVSRVDPLTKSIAEIIDWIDHLLFPSPSKSRRK